MPVDKVARRAGFGTGANFRKRLSASLGVTLTTYRRTYRTSSD